MEKTVMIVLLRITPMVPVNGVGVKDYVAPRREHEPTYPYRLGPTVEKIHAGMAVWSPHPL